MKLSRAIIEEELAESFELVLSADEEDERMRLLPPLIYDGGPMEEDRVYVLPPDRTPPPGASSSALAFCTAGSECCSDREYDCPVIGTNASSTVQLLNQIQIIYEKYSNWETGMNGILTEDRDTLKQLMDLAARTHHNLFLLQDASFTPIVVSFGGVPMDASKDYKMIAALIGKPLPKEAQDVIWRYFPERRKSRTVMHHDETEFETLDIPLYDGGIFVGMLSMMMYNRPFQRKDKSILLFLSDYISFALTKSSEKKFPATTLTSIFSDLLDSRHISKEEISQVCAAVGFRENDNFIISAISFPTEDKAPFAKYIHRQIISRGDGTVACQKGSILAVAVNTNRRDVGIYLRMLEDYAKQFELQIGISDSFSNFQHCEAYYTEASATLTLLERNSPPGIYFFRDYSVPYILERCSGKLKPWMLYSPGFRRLLKYDSGTAVDYIETLKVYLEENLNSAKSARRLYISRNTFLARCERLCSVLQEDLNDPDVRFRLEVSLRLYEKDHGAEE